MLILGIDTSGRQGSLALLRAEGHELHTLALAPISGGRYSELVVPTLSTLLQEHGLEKSSLQLIGVASGPGSFTGLRVAIATAKGLAEALDIPVVAVSVLEAVAEASRTEKHPEGTVVAALDAQRGELYWAEYELAAPGLPRLLREALSPLAKFNAMLASGELSAPIFTPDESLMTKIAGGNVQHLPQLTAEAYARMAHRKFTAGVRDDLAALDAHYLRPSEAEILAALRSGGQ